MKIAILTQPLHNNYGGLLQAFALQYYLKQYGHDVMTVDFSRESKPRFWGLKSILGNVIRKYILLRSINTIFPLTDKKRREIGQHTNRFTAEYISTTQKICLEYEFEYIKRYSFDAYIIGSDQVWRPSYSSGISAFFLSFLSKDEKVKRIAYAASFGVDHCNEFSAEQFSHYAQLLQQFDAVSVREDSAVKLCQQYFGIRAEHVIDPTLLLDQDVYYKLVEKDNTLPSDGSMMVYILDKSPDKQKIVDMVCNECDFKPYTVMPEEDGIYPPVTQWLRGFIDAKYVVTDSFHGVVFSIIFNKPFIAIGNYDRGLARFSSILKKFSLEERLILSSQEIDRNLIHQDIDFNAVNRIKAHQQNIVKLFFSRVLTDIN
ncbi:polysaccharide pyruvyl transferase family protein [Vibrio metschnikovii]|nr:polysaccharide pyruvyl transferase family protein [Vibrio metschnikovii]EKO3649483.1 polysaccharide pyruvyl transferase family protein [Vibrio metschnikovii]EKO3873630.1 polysaccharide pyruvyl transferase family protein [Vibrio metschnikovii]